VTALFRRIEKGPTLFMAISGDNSVALSTFGFESFGTLGRVTGFKTVFDRSSFSGHFYRSQ
jgi:hypothetical protein